MGLIHKKILGVSITFSRKDSILKEIEKYFNLALSEKRKAGRKTIKPLIIFTPNPEIIIFAQKDNNFKEVVNSSQINLPDGSGVVWAVDKIFRDKIEKISGSDFVWELTEFAAKKGLTIGLIGGRNGVALTTRECLIKKYPKLKAVVLGEPEIKFPISNEQIIKETINKISKGKIRILFVALGFPKQEYFINSIKREALSVKIPEPLVLMSVGGAFDYISGRVPRAPLFIRNMGLEWLFRLIREPQRLERQIRGARFFWDIFTS